jgi:hypothetical protein
MAGDGPFASGRRTASKCSNRQKPASQQMERGFFRLSALGSKLKAGTHAAVECPMFGKHPVAW